jgi:SAM-dependent methyltransferase
LRSRYEILFGTWFQGQTRAVISVRACRRCGFVAFAPRPEEADLRAKYEMSLAMPRSRAVRPPDNASDEKRARELAAEFDGVLSPGASVLDVGGGDGRLMAPLVTAGHSAFVVDFKPEPVSGVTRLGATVDDLLPTARFDAMVLSHVLEHVAEPLALLEKLHAHLNDAGHLLVEVPMELFRQIPPKREPLTHINYFHSESLRVVLLRAGLVPLRCDFGWHYTEKQIVVRALCKKAAPSLAPQAHGFRLTRALIAGNPTPLLPLLQADRNRTLHSVARYGVRRGKGALLGVIKKLRPAS